MPSHQFFSHYCISLVTQKSFSVINAIAGPAVSNAFAFPGVPLD